MVHFSLSFGRAAVALAAFGLAHTAQAETIAVEGVYAARASLPADVELVLIERFRGDLGQDMELALTQRLGNVVIRGEPYFDLITPAALRGASVRIENADGNTSTRPLTPDAQFRGTVRSEVIEREVDPKRIKECVARDEDKKCVKREDVYYDCWELSVRVDARLLLTGAGGQQLYSHNTPRVADERFCADSDYVPSSLDMESGLIEGLADDIRRDLAPVERRQDIRVMESRKGLRKEDRGPFRDAVRATKDSASNACEGFEALEASNPSHVSVLFNIGLCHESAGDLDGALDCYTRALSVDPGRDYPTQGLRRVRSRMEAEALLAERA